MIAYQVFGKNDMHPSKGAKAKCCNVYNLNETNAVERMCRSLKKKKFFNNEKFQNDFVLNEYFYVTWSNVIMKHFWNIACYYFLQWHIFWNVRMDGTV